MPPKKYKKYLSNSGVAIPKTTAWRYRAKKSSNAIEEAADHHSPAMKRKRRFYNTNQKTPIPRQTLWYWKKTKTENGKNITSM